MLGFKVSERSVSRYLKVHFPTNNRGQGWSKFLSNHRSSILSIDLFYSYTLALKRIEGLVIVDHLRRKIIHTSAARVITSDWVVQQLINAFPGECPYKYLICDNGNIFRDQFKAEVESLLGLKVMHIPKGRPWLNGICERTIGSLRRELLDHVILLNERHLGHLLAKYQSYYNSDRTHLGLGKETPNGREAMKKSGLKLISEAIFGGLHHRYRWREAA